MAAINRIKIGILGVPLLLAGCAGPSPYITPVEERSLASRTEIPAGTVVPVERERFGVSVAPVGELPSFSPQSPRPVPAITPSATQAPLINRNSSSAVVALLGEAQQASGRGDLAAAESQIERALRIAPRDPQVYLQLASLKRRQGEYLQAEQVALRGVAVASAQPEYKKLLWRELALIRTQAGDMAGAAQAEAEAERY